MSPRKVKKNSEVTSSYRVSSVFHQVRSLSELVGSSGWGGADQGPLVQECGANVAG